MLFPVNIAMQTDRAINDTLQTLQKEMHVIHLVNDDGLYDQKGSYKVKQFLFNLQDRKPMAHRWADRKSCQFYIFQLNFLHFLSLFLFFCSLAVLWWLSLLHNFINQSLNSVQIQILFVACQRFAMVRISDNNPNWK